MKNKTTTPGCIFVQGNQEIPNSGWSTSMHGETLTLTTTKESKATKVSIIENPKATKNQHAMEDDLASINQSGVTKERTNKNRNPNGALHLETLPMPMRLVMDNQVVVLFKQPPDAAFESRDNGSTIPVEFFQPPTV
ncbi:hypothetical protein ACH5RR_009023 [Cinchona calisaya]|uniref:Uncharacterized protein n=1 Tax=Cinchona calisaya TaxID=153742 RepID=A0ABD3AD49_9GENT